MPADGMGRRRLASDGPRAPRSTLLRRLLGNLRHQRRLGRAYQPRFGLPQLALSWLGALVAIGLLGVLSIISGHGLFAAPLGASSVLLFGYPASPLAQPRNIVLGNTVAAVIAVVLVALGGRGIWAIALAVGLTIAAGQMGRCLHPPAGGVAFLGVFLGVSPGFLLFPILSGSLLLVAMGWLFHRWLCQQGLKQGEPYPVHWL